MKNQFTEKRSIEIEKIAHDFGLEYKQREDYNDGYWQYVKLIFWRTFSSSISASRTKLYNFLRGSLNGKQIIFFDVAIDYTDVSYGGSIIKIDNRIYPFRGLEMDSNLLRDYFYSSNEDKLAAASQKNLKNRHITLIVSLICFIIFIILMYIFKI